VAVVDVRPSFDFCSVCFDDPTRLERLRDAVGKARQYTPASPSNGEDTSSRYTNDTPSITKARLYELYWGKRWAMGLVADEYDTSRRQIRRRMNEYGIPRRRGGGHWDGEGVPEGFRVPEDDPTHGSSVDWTALTSDGDDSILGGEALGVDTREEARSLLYELYWGEWLSLSAMATRLDVHKETAGRYLDEYDVPTRSSGKADPTTTIPKKYQWDTGWDDVDKRTLYELYWGDERSLADIAAEYNTSRRRVRERMDEYGIPRRKRGRWGDGKIPNGFRLDVDNHDATQTGEGGVVGDD
jgi:predicted DNA-binding protein YlxM (UPF0122 family)